MTSSPAPLTANTANRYCMQKSIKKNVVCLSTGRSFSSAPHNMDQNFAKVTPDTESTDGSTADTSKEGSAPTRFSDVRLLF